MFWLQDAAMDVESCAHKNVKREQSLHKSNDFKRLYQEGINVRVGGFVFYFLRTDNLPHRLGVIASRRTGCAVERNRYRRRVRCLYHLLQEKLQQPYNAVVIATSTFAVMSHFSKMQDIFLKAFEKLSLIENDRRVRT